MVYSTQFTIVYPVVMAAKPQSTEFLALFNYRIEEDDQEINVLALSEVVLLPSELEMEIEGLSLANHLNSPFNLNLKNEYPVYIRDEDDLDYFRESLVDKIMPLLQHLPSDQN